MNPDPTLLSNAAPLPSKFAAKHPCALSQITKKGSACLLLWMLQFSSLVKTANKENPSKMEWKVMRSRQVRASPHLFWFRSQQEAIIFDARRDNEMAELPPETK
mmetsp:Transcript_68/g.120  ORF Transcript_68/g.120 Transcript_68/m.120 type:complete len:104 (-) Transcript_68:832-1143(-)